MAAREGLGELPGLGLWNGRAPAPAAALHALSRTVPLAAELRASPPCGVATSSIDPGSTVVRRYLSMSVGSIAGIRFSRSPSHDRASVL